MRLSQLFCLFSWKIFLPITQRIGYHGKTGKVTEHRPNHFPFFQLLIKISNVLNILSNALYELEFNTSFTINRDTTFPLPKSLCALMAQQNLW